ncbi:MAG: ThuA domain-containing protein [Kiritimatiellaeota bacterium]|nr:ThuA domain-containing protein [Kiritimatiellota bacterium]
MPVQLRNATLPGACLAALLAATPAPAAPVRVLVFSGQNNHGWAETTPVLKNILTASGRCTVDVTAHPEQCTAATFAKYDCLLSNWNTYGGGGVKEWPEPTRKAFLEFVRGGHGFVVVHAGGTMFPDWTEFHKLIGATWGPQTGHGAIHAFEVKFTDAGHPVTRGLAPFVIRDELWHRMAAQPEKKVLATAFSSKERGGSGQAEPVVMVTEFGKGRCFNLVLGHDGKTMDHAGFRKLLIRGVEWAATGQVASDSDAVTATAKGRLPE